MRRFIRNGGRVILGGFAAMLVWAEKPEIRESDGISLAAETTSIRPGEPFTIAVRFDLPAGWHTYWLNPGDSGMPPHLSWTLPPSVILLRESYPAPRRFESDGMITFGFESPLVMLVDFMLSNEAQGPELELTLTADWLICREECRPRTGQSALALPVRVETPVPAPAVTSLFARIRASMPVPADDWVAEARLDGRLWRFRLTPPPGPAAQADLTGSLFLPALGGMTDSADPGRWTRDGASWVVTINKGDTLPPDAEPVTAVLSSPSLAAPLMFRVPVRPGGTRAKP